MTKGTGINLPSVFVREKSRSGSVLKGPCTVPIATASASTPVSRTKDTASSGSVKALRSTPVLFCYDTIRCL